MLTIAQTTIGNADEPIKKFVHARMKAQNEFTMRVIDADVIYSICFHTVGDHIEIGVLHGGSAIVAAFAKKTAGRREKVYAVDKIIQGHAIDNAEIYSFCQAAHIRRDF